MKPLRYQVEMKATAQKAMRKLSSKQRNQVFERLRLLEDNLQGDVKKLTKHFPEFRMRSGNLRILFEIAGNTNHRV